MTELTKFDLKIGGKYNWRNQPERLVYMGTMHYQGDRRTWHQFALVNNPDAVWCEVIDSDIGLFEETMHRNQHTEGKQ